MSRIYILNISQSFLEENMAFYYVDFELGVSKQSDISKMTK